MRWIVRTRRLIKHLPHLWRNGRTRSATDIRIRDQISHMNDAEFSVMHAYVGLLVERQIRFPDREPTERQFDRLVGLALDGLALRLARPSLWSIIKNFIHSGNDGQDYILEYMRQVNHWKRGHPGQLLTDDFFAQFNEEARSRVNVQRAAQHRL